MASTGIDLSSPGYTKDAEKDAVHRSSIPAGPDSSSEIGIVDHTHRKLKSRHIQLIGIGGTIGTVLFVQIGKTLIDGGPASLFLGFSLWCSVILAVTMGAAEMVTYLPISSPFIRFSGRYVDEALSFMQGWNFFIFEAMLVPFEVTACNVIITFWSDVVPVGVIIAIVIILYAVLNIVAVKWYGESEFWASLGKVILIVGLIIFTFIVMVGGNPQHDAFGFRNWYDPGSFREYYTKGSLGRFQGFLQCFIYASFSISGPDYVSMAAGEAENPRVVMPRAFNAVFYRLTSFFMLGALCVGILVPWDDKELNAAIDDGRPGAAASPYVVAMNHLGIPVLPHIVNALVLTASFSAGNSYVYCASRSLFGMALEGKAPKVLTRCTKSGVPIYCVGVVLVIALLSFLQLGNSAQVVLSWFVNLVTASQLINYTCMGVTYLFFYRALKAQGFNRDDLPYKAWGMPYTAFYGVGFTGVMAIVGGYTVFLPGKWNVPTFLFSYMMIFVCPVLFVGWKLWHKTKMVDPRDADLYKDVAEIEEYQKNYVPMPPRNFADKWLNLIFG